MTFHTLTIVTAGLTLPWSTFQEPSAKEPGAGRRW